MHGGDCGPRFGWAFGSEIMTDSRYAAFEALDPFFNVIRQGLATLHGLPCRDDGAQRLRLMFSHVRPPEEREPVPAERQA